VTPRPRLADALLHATGSALVGLTVGGLVAMYGTRHITSRAVRRLEAAGRTDEAAAHRAVLRAHAAR
jgi:hypothetical protein